MAVGLFDHVLPAGEMAVGGIRVIKDVGIPQFLIGRSVEANVNHRKR